MGAESQLEKGTPVARRVRKARGLSQTAQPPDMPRFLHIEKKRPTLGVLVGLIAMVSTVAFAYWSSSGEASSAIHSNYASAPLEVTSVLVENLYPGASAAVSVKVKNVDPAQSEFLTKLEVEVEKTSAAECKKEWFVVTPASQEPKVLIAHGETKEYTVHLEMKEEALVNQNACQGASVTLKYKAS